MHQQDCIKLKMTKNNVQRVPIILSTNDFDLLYSIQQGYLFSGKSVRSLWQLSEILKAVLLHSSYNMLNGDLVHLNQVLRPFFENHSVPLSQLPTEYDVISTVKNHLGVKSVPINTEGVPDPGTDRGTTVFDYEFDFNKRPGDLPASGKTSNFILTLRDGEVDFLHVLKTLIESYVKRELSYSEIVRTLFRSLMVIKGKESFFRSNRWKYLSSLYLGSLYGFSPIDSVLIFSETDELWGISVSDKSYNVLSRILRDEGILNRYIKDMESSLDAEFRAKDLDKEGAMKVLQKGYGFSEIDKNSEREDGYRSAVADFGFHSALIGYILLFLEWDFEQHKLPLLISYLLGESKPKDGSEPSVPISLGNIYGPPLFKDWFAPRLKMLYSISRTYGEKGRLL